MRAVGRDPLFVERARGAELFDVDGNRYVDYVCSWGPLILGHAHPEVVDAVAAAAARGTSFGAPTPAEVDLAAEVVQRVPGVEMVRLVSSGTEAAMTAVRLARAATGRERVIKFAGCYHGHVDGLLAEAGSGLATQGIPASPGVTRRAGGGHDRRALERPGSVRRRVRARRVTSWRRSWPSRCPANMGVVPAQAGFPRPAARALRRRRRAAGPGRGDHRLPRGCRRGPGECSACVADLTLLGKVLGGGLPLAAVAGPRR